MLFARLLIGTTILVVLGYFVLLTSSRTEGTLKTFGKYLAIWLFALPVLLIIAAATMGRRHSGPVMMHSPVMMHGSGVDGPWTHQSPGIPPGPPEDGRPPPPAAQPPATEAPQSTPSPASTAK
jgi:hypothetical protein